MQSYSIDPTVFYPPDIPEDDDLKMHYRKQLREYLKTIEKCYYFIHEEDKSVYIFHHCGEKQLNDEYKCKAKKFGIPVDKYKQKLDDILLFNMPKLYHGKKIGAKKYYFEEWFDFIKNFEYSETKHNPLLEHSGNKKLANRINLICVINNYVYHNLSTHFLILKEEIDGLHIETKQLKFLLNKKPHNYEILNSKIQIKSILSLDINNENGFDSVRKVYEYAKEQFSKHLTFGKDVERGLNTIRLNTGQNIIFAYLKTLIEYCEYKKTIKNDLRDDYILQSLGCICSNENDKQMEIEDFKRARMFDNGKNEKILFNLHLKPRTFSECKDEKRTVRIYIAWDTSEEKVIIGWIGKHL